MKELRVKAVTANEKREKMDAENQAFGNNILSICCHRPEKKQEKRWKNDDKLEKTGDSKNLIGILGEPR